MPQIHFCYSALHKKYFKRTITIKLNQFIELFLFLFLYEKYIDIEMSIINLSLDNIILIINYLLYYIVFFLTSRYIIYFFTGILVKYLVFRTSQNFNLLYFNSYILNTFGTNKKTSNNILQICFFIFKNIS